MKYSSHLCKWLIYHKHHSNRHTSDRPVLWRVECGGICGSKGRSRCLCDCCCSRHLLHNSVEGDHLSAAENAEQHRQIKRAFNLLDNQKFTHRHIKTEQSWAQLECLQNKATLRPSQVTMAFETQPICLREYFILKTI